MLGLALQVLNGRLYASASPAIVADGDAREHQRAGMLRSYATLKKRLRNARAVRNCPGWSTPSQLHRTEPGAVFAEGAQFCQWPDGLEPRNCNCPGCGGKQPAGLLMLRCVVRDSNSGHQLLLPPANWCPSFASRTKQGDPSRRGARAGVLGHVWPLC